MHTTTVDPLTLRDDTRILEARSIRTLAELLAFTHACIAASGGDVRIGKPLDLCLTATKMADGTDLHDLFARPW